MHKFLFFRQRIRKTNPTDIWWKRKLRSREGLPYLTISRKHDSWILMRFQLQSQYLTFWTQGTFTTSLEFNYMGIRAVLRNLKWRCQNLGFQKTNFGTRLKIASFMDHLVFKEIFTDKIYDEFIIRALKKRSNENEPRRVFDIGANLGFFTVRCCEIWNQLG